MVEEIVTACFPEALGAFEAGSTARGEDTASSDLDVVVVVPGPPAPLRRTERHGGRLVEFFVHTEDSLVRFFDRERERRRSPLLHMVAFGRLVGDRDQRVARLREVAVQRWDAGPPVLGHAEREDRRYRLTALLDDLAAETDPRSRAAIAVTVFSDVAEVALASRSAWGGTGRWLVRRLDQTAPGMGGELLAGLHAALHGDPHQLIGVGRAELDRLGGPLDEGYERDG